jgi:hypothetical protein
MLKLPDHGSMHMSRDNASFALRNKVEKVLHFGDQFNFLLDASNGLGYVEIGMIQQAE